MLGSCYRNTGCQAGLQTYPRSSLVFSFNQEWKWIWTVQLVLPFWTFGSSKASRTLAWVHSTDSNCDKVSIHCCQLEKYSNVKWPARANAHFKRSCINSGVFKKVWKCQFKIHFHVGSTKLGYVLLLTFEITDLFVQHHIQHFQNLLQDTRN